jgi:hypothetical protein
VNQNQPIPVDGEQPVLNDKEIKFMGECRWDAKYGKRFFCMIIVALLLGYGAVKLAQKLPGSPVGFIAGVVMVVGFFFAYRKYIHTPKKKAGEEFLAAKPITPFNTIKK